MPKESKAHVCAWVQHQLGGVFLDNSSFPAPAHWVSRHLTLVTPANWYHRYKIGLENRSTSILLVIPALFSSTSSDMTSFLQRWAAQWRKGRVDSGRTLNSRFSSGHHQCQSDRWAKWSTRTPPVSSSLKGSPPGNISGKVTALVQEPCSLVTTVGSLSVSNENPIDESNLSSLISD